MRVAAAVFSLAILIPAGNAWTADSPESILASRGLHVVDRAWYAAPEWELRERLASLDRLERRTREARKAVEGYLGQYADMKEQVRRLEELEKQSREAAKSAKDGSPQRKLLDEEVKRLGNRLEQLKRQLVPPNRLGAVAPLKPALMEWVNARAELGLAVLQCRTLIEQLPAVYSELRSDTAITQALDSLKSPGHLGSGKSYNAEQRTLSRLEKLVFDADLPLYREGKQLRLGVIANDEVPLTLSLFSNRDPLVITHSMAQRLGLELKPSTPTKTHRIGDLEAKVFEVKLRSVRLGQFVMRDLPALVLSADLESLGGRIGTDALPGVSAKIDAETLTLNLSEAAFP